MKKDVLVVFFLINFIVIIANIAAFVFQLALHELPCPLCLLQRFGLLTLSFGTLCSLKDGKKLKYDIAILISSVFLLVVALRQVLLHIAPHDSGYGGTFLNLHLYTWSALLSFFVLCFIAVARLFDFLTPKFLYNHLKNHKLCYYKFILIILILLTLANLVSTYLECGFGMCPANPDHYIELSKI